MSFVTLPRRSEGAELIRVCGRQIPTLTEQPQPTKWGLGFRLSSLLQLRGNLTACKPLLDLLSPLLSLQI
jgi:hypothetical protein